MSSKMGDGMLLKFLFLPLIASIAGIGGGCSRSWEETSTGIPPTPTQVGQAFVRPDFIPPYDDISNLFLSDSLPVSWEIYQPLRSFTERWEAGEYQGKIYYTWKITASEGYVLYKSKTDKTFVIGIDLKILIYDGRNQAKSSYRDLLRYGSQYVSGGKKSFSIGDILDPTSIVWETYRQGNNTWSFIYTTNVVGWVEVKGGVASAQEVLDTTKAWMEMLVGRFDKFMPMSKL